MPSNDPDKIVSGPNSWLIEEMYQQFLDDPESVGETWREFFADYSPRPGEGNGARRTPETPTEGAQAPAAAKARQPVDEVRPRPAEAPTPKAAEPTEATEDLHPLRGTEAAIAKHMEASLDVPTATSVR